jgi:uncharacterized membrane protein YuzA (DUF378 family)
LDKITWILLIIGGINWLLVGLFQYDLVAAITGNAFGEVSALRAFIYILVGLSALYQIFAFRKLTTGYRPIS